MTSLADSAFRRHYGEIYRFLRRRTGDPDRAEELTQRVFADAVVALDSVEAPGEVLPLLYTVARRRFADEARRRARFRTVAFDTEREADVEHGPTVARAIAAALAALPERQRAVVIAKLVQGRSFAEIASTAGASEDACKMRFARGLRAMRAHLRAEGIEP